MSSCCIANHLGGRSPLRVIASRTQEIDSTRDGERFESMNQMAGSLFETLLQLSGKPK